MLTLFGELTLKQFIVFQLLAHSVRYLLIAGGAYLVFWRLLKDRIRHRSTSFDSVRRGQIKKEILWSLSSIGCFALIAVGVFYASEAGYVRLYNKVSDHGWLYWFASLITLMAVHETYFYFIHRVMHHPFLFKRVHAVHHESLNPTPFTSFSFHPLEAFLEALVVPTMLCLLPFHVGVILTYQFLTLALNVNGHLGFELYPADHATRPLLRFINTATLHGHHHKAFNCNYGLYTTFWDRWLGTTDP